MDKEHEPLDSWVVDDLSNDSSSVDTTSLTDLMDRMDRAAFLRSLASRPSPQPQTEPQDT